MMVIRVPISTRTYGNLNGRSVTQRSGATLRGGQSMLPILRVIDQLFRECPHPVNAAGGPANVHPRVAAVGPTQLREPLREPREVGLCVRIVFAPCHQHADPPHPVRLLRARRERPRRRAAEQRDELASFHSITSSAMLSS